MDKRGFHDYEEEFEEMVGSLSDVIQELSDPIAIATLLYTIAEERKSTNLVIKGIDSKFDFIKEKIGKFELLIEKLERISKQLEEISKKLDKQTAIKNVEGEIKTQRQIQQFYLSERDIEILEYVKTKGLVCAEDIQKKFQYKGKNAASARLSRLFQSNLLEKEYRGRKVYYKLKNPQMTLNLLPD